MKFYHGTNFHARIEKCREICPSIEHHYELTPHSVISTVKGDWFLDNGAYGGNFCEAEWIKTLDKIKGWSNQPDFIVLPDVFNSWKETKKRNRYYVSECRFRELPYYVVAQPPATAEEVIDFAKELGAEGIFIGGEMVWKRQTAPHIIGKTDRPVHIGKPGDFYWAYKIGADSMDSTSIVMNKDWQRLQNLEDKITTQTSLPLM